MLTISSNWSKTLLLVGLSIALAGLQGAFAQSGQGQQSPQSGQSSESERQETAQRSQRAPAPTQENEPLIHGVSVGGGLAIYQGDYSLNPNHHIIKYIAGNGTLSLNFGLDHRLGRFDQYGLGADLVYSRITGETTGETAFSTNSLALDFYADYELPYIKEGLFRVFIGAGPNLIFSPSYAGTPVSREEGAVQQLGTRMIGSLKVGVTIMDALRIGTRIASTDLLDGYKGYNPDGIPDFVSFVNVKYRFSVK